MARYVYEHMLSIIVSAFWYHVIIIMSIFCIMGAIFIFCYDTIVNTPEDDDDIDLFPPFDEDK